MQQNSLFISSWLWPPWLPSIWAQHPLLTLLWRIWKRSTACSSSCHHHIKLPLILYQVLLVSLTVQLMIKEKASLKGRASMMITRQGQHILIAWFQIFIFHFQCDPDFCWREAVLCGARTSFSSFNIYMIIITWWVFVSCNESITVLDLISQNLFIFSLISSPANF